jgi:hypothetical protein
LSLTVLRAVLTKCAVEAISRGRRHRRWRRAYRPSYREYYYRGEPRYRVDSYRYERERLPEEELVPSRAGFRHRVEPIDDWTYAPVDRFEEPIAEDSFGVSLPVNMI